VSLRDPGTDRAVWQEPLTLAPRAVARLRLDVDELRTAAKEVRLGVDPLPTPNGKPYVMMRYGSGPLSVHHG
jgi:hypothetical protein